MIDTIARADVDVDETLVSEIESALAGADNYTLADALREGALSTTQVRETFGRVEGEGCALTAISTAMLNHRITF